MGRKWLVDIASSRRSAPVGSNHLSVLFLLSQGAPTRPEDFASRINLQLVKIAIDRLVVTPKVSYICCSNSSAETVAQLLLQIQTGIEPN